jgi:hypothetical protein
MVGCGLLCCALAGEPLIVNPDEFAKPQPVVVRDRLSSPLVLRSGFPGGAFGRSEHRPGRTVAATEAIQISARTMSRKLPILDTSELQSGV